MQRFLISDQPTLNMQTAWYTIHICMYGVQCTYTSRCTGGSDNKKIIINVHVYKENDTDYWSILCVT